MGRLCRTAHLELMPVGEPAMFHIQVDTTDNAELAVSVQGPKTDLPVKVAGNVKNGFTAEFLPEEVGAYTVCVEYNRIPVGGTPFVGKAFDASMISCPQFPGEPSGSLCSSQWTPARQGRATWRSPSLPGAGISRPRCTLREALGLQSALFLLGH